MHVIAKIDINNKLSNSVLQKIESVNEECAELI